MLHGGEFGASAELGWERNIAALAERYRVIDNLKQHVRDNSANYKVPRSISVLTELPRGGTDKILRTDLQTRADTG